MIPTNYFRSKQPVSRNRHFLVSKEHPLTDPNDNQSVSNPASQSIADPVRSFLRNCPFHLIFPFHLRVVLNLDKSRIVPSSEVEYPATSQDILKKRVRVLDANSKPTYVQKMHILGSM